MCSPHTSSHFTAFVQRAAKACLLKPGPGKQLESRGSSEEALCTLDGMTSEGSSDVSMLSRDTADWRGECQSTVLIHVEQLTSKVKAIEDLLNETFATVSSLKNAYIQMQLAHSPYHPDKLQLADKAVVLELKKLSELKQAYKGRRWMSGGPREERGQWNSSSNEVRELRMELMQKDEEVDKLKEVVGRLATRKEKLERRMRRLEKRSMKEAGGLQELVPTVQLLESAMKAAKEATRSFVKRLMGHMRGANWDLDAAVRSIEPGIQYAKQSHKKYAVQSYVSLRLFNGFENENFYISGTLSCILDPAKHRKDCFSQFQDMQYMDPTELLCITPDCLFGKFCHKKFLQIIHPKMEESFFGNFQHRNQIVNGEHPRSEFYEAFLKVAKAVWLVHKLAFAFDPIASIFQVRKAADYCAAYMESVVQNVEMENESLDLVPKVGFTVMPGFRVGKTTIRCQVYLNGMKPSLP